MIGAPSRKKLGASFSNSTQKANRACTAETDGRVVLMHDMVLVGSQSLPSDFSLVRFYNHLATISFFFFFGPHLANNQAPRQ
jgi:hypothetical protein